MSSNTLADLLARLRATSPMLGWGAIAAFSRSHLNAMLERQFVEGFSAAHLLMPFSGEIPLNESGTAVVQLSSVVFGPPRLSFDRAELGTRKASLSIELVGGDFVELDRMAGRGEELRASSRLTEGMGFELTMEIDLRAVGSETDHTGRVLISAENGRNPTCNLVTSPVPQTLLGEVLLAHVLKQPQFKTQYTLAVADAGNYAPLSPIDFEITTQAAPGATRADAENAGDGAVLIFMRVRGLKWEYGSLPIEGSGFPYLIPDDKGPDGALYSASLVIARPLINIVDDTQLQVLKRQLLPPSHVFVEAANGRYTPHDMLVVGNLGRAPGHVSIEPQLISLKNAQSQQFTARRGDGTPVTPALGWSTRCLNTPGAAGTISSSGAYRAPQKTVDRRSVLPMVITATLSHSGEQNSASGVVFTRFENLNVAPLVANRAAEPGAPPVRLVASSVARGGLQWQLLGAKLGRLDDLGGGHAIYYPPASSDEPLVAQAIEVRDLSTSESVQAVVVLTGLDHMLKIEPGFVQSRVGRSTQQFVIPEKALAEQLDALGVAEADRRDVTYTWHVIGEGAVESTDHAALYTPPMTLSSAPVAVVGCVLSVQGITLHGYSVLELADRELEIPHWEELHAFNIEALGDTRVFANGMQQVPVRIRIETKPLDSGEYIEVSPDELGTLKFVDIDTHNDVPKVGDGQEGIPHGSVVDWAYSDARNRFRPFRNPRALQEVPEPPREGGIPQYVNFYLHLAAPISREFYAVFEDIHGRVHKSTEKGAADHKTIRIHGEPLPNRELENYQFKRVRVWNGNEAPDIPGEEDHPFDYILTSIDFWLLNYHRQNMESVGFATLQIEGHSSTIRWESELIDEIFFSHTGYALNPINHLVDPKPPTALSFDPYFNALNVAVGHPPPDDGFHAHPPSPGQLLVSLHRLADMTYWYDGMAGAKENMNFREQLDGPVTYVLRDAEGTRHRLQIGFRDASISESRNELVMILQ